MDKFIAERIINSLETGVVSFEDISFFNVGRSKEIDLLTELLRETEEGKSNILFIHGDYGVGKTHFLNLIRENALNDKFVASYVTLSSRECPLSNMVWVYGNILKKLTYRADHKDFGLLPFLDLWLCLVEKRISKYRNYKCKHNLTYLTCSMGCMDELYSEHMPEINAIHEDLKNAIKFYKHAFLRENSELKELIIRWILGERLKRTDFNYINNQLRLIQLLNNINYENAFDMFRSISKLSKILGFKGFVIFLDEAERIPSIFNVLDGYVNLIRIIIQSAKMPGVLIIYATTPQFYEDAKRHFKYFEREETKELLEGIYHRMESERLELSILSSKELTLLTKKLIKIFLKSKDGANHYDYISRKISHDIKILKDNSSTMREYIVRLLPIIKESYQHSHEVIIKI